MDIITHSLAGIAVGTFSGEPLSVTNPIYICSVLGAMAPDIDVLWGYKKMQRRRNLPTWVQHRAFTHSLVGMPLLALIIAAGVNLLFPASSFWLLFLFALLGALSHGLLDLTNCYGVNILWPIKKRPYSLNIVPLVDPILISILILMGLTVNWYKPLPPALLLFLVCYIILRRIYFFRTRNFVSAHFAVEPTAIQITPPRVGLRKWVYSVDNQEMCGEVVFFPKVNLVEENK